MAAMTQNRVSHGARAEVLRGATSKRVTVLMFLVFGLTGVLLMSPFPKALLYLFPLMATLAAVYASRHSLRIYVAFCIWLWLLTPLVRRLVDYRAGWIPATMVLLAPYLAVTVPLLFQLAHGRRLMSRFTVPLFVIIAASIYGCAAGLLNYSLSIVLQDLFLWLSPISIAFYVFLHRDKLSEVYEGVESAFTYGLLVVGVYGLVQFFWLPKWDVLWMQEMALGSVGPAEALKVRVFSSLNSPQVLASFLSSGLLIILGSTRKLRFLAIPAALIALLLSLARSGWLSLLVGLCYLMFYLSVRQRLALTMIAIVSLGILSVASLDKDVSVALTQRFDTFSSLSRDNSYMDRMEGYRAFAGSLLAHPFGLGIGTAASQQKDMSVSLGSGGQEVYMGDSSFVSVLTSLGVVGALTYLVALCMLVVQSYSGKASSRRGARASQAALLGLMVEAPLMNVIAGPAAFLVWLFIGLLVAQRAVHVEQESRSFHAVRIGAERPLEVL